MHESIKDQHEDSMKREREREEGDDWLVNLAVIEERQEEGI